MALSFFATHDMKTHFTEIVFSRIGFNGATDQICYGGVNVERCEIPRSANKEETESILIAV
jgi:hypothetical protein